MKTVLLDKVAAKHLAAADWLGSDHQHPMPQGNGRADGLGVTYAEAWTYGQRAFVDGWDAALRTRPVPEDEFFISAIEAYREHQKRCTDPFSCIDDVPGSPMLGCIAHSLSAALEANKSK